MKQFKIIAAVSAAAIMLCGCGNKNNGNTVNDSDEISSGQTVADVEVDLDSMDFSFTDRETDPSYSGGEEISANGKAVSITKTGTYILSGSYGRVTVDAPDSEKIQLVLNDADISDKSGPAIYIKSADKVFITLAENSVNTVSDGDEYSGFSGDEENTDGAIFSRADLCINGYGTLDITANYKCGIVSKDDLVITGGSIAINSKGRAIEGKDCVKLTGCKLNAESGGDGIHSTDTENGAHGYIYIESGEYNIVSANDAFQAETVLNIAGGNFNLKTDGGSANAATVTDKDRERPAGFGGGYSSAETKTESAKALKAESLIKITGGTFNIDSSDDSIHCGGDLQIDDGNITASSGDDGIHSDSSVIINGGTVKITKSYEGIEGVRITVNGGNIDVTSADDGFNAAGGNDGSSLGGRPGQNSFETGESPFIVINGGYILVNASGDGIDSNGSFTMAGGVLLVSGPTDNGDGALDYESTAIISGGTAIFAGSSGMAESFSSDSTQPSVMYNIDTAVGGTSLSVTDKNGNVLASFTPKKQYGNVVISAAGMQVGSDYTVNIGGTVSGADENGFATSGTVSDVTTKYDFTLSSVATSNSPSNGGMGGGGMHGGMGGGMGDRFNPRR